MGSADDVIPQAFGRYRVERVLGTGAMGTVYEAVDELLGRRVAVKTVKVKAGKAEVPKRFLHEAKAVAAVSHPNIVPIFDIGFEGSVPFIVMELVKGATLKTRIDQGRLPPDAVRVLGHQLADALATAHAAGIVHRDVKPANVLEGGPGSWKLADFGVAHVPDSSLTMTGQFVGSVAYAPPEALVLGQLGPPADVYGLGATLYEAACGERPYANASDGNLGAVLTRPPPPGLDAIVPGFPTELSNAILATLAAEPGKRPTAADLASWLVGPRASSPAISAPAIAAPMVVEPSGPSSIATTAIANPRRSRLPLVVGGLAAVAVIGGIVFAVGNRGGAPAAQLPPDAAVVVAPPPPPPDAAVEVVDAPVASSIEGLAPLRDAVHAGRGSSALSKLLALQKKYPKDGEIPYLMGIVYFSNRVDGEAIRLFEIAIANDAKYKTDDKLIKTTLQYGLQTATYPWRVANFLKSHVGDAAIPYLEDFAKAHPNARVRQHAKAVRAKL